MTEEPRSMIYGIDTFMKRLESSFRNEKDILKRLKGICDQAYYDIAFNEFHPQGNNTAFCASQWPLVRLPVATWRYEWPEVNRPLCVRS